MPLSTRHSNNLDSHELKVINLKIKFGTTTTTKKLVEGYFWKASAQPSVWPSCTWCILFSWVHGFGSHACGNMVSNIVCMRIVSREAVLHHEVTQPLSWFWQQIAIHNLGTAKNGCLGTETWKTCNMEILQTKSKLLKNFDLQIPSVCS